ncbi:hypothetical protein [Undibacterium sp.]|uniref:hypothetical protein n=1 Tax=Undibacterium sp. TaxID=1914977 RepID=UPI003750BEF3
MKQKNQLVTSQSDVTKQDEQLATQPLLETPAAKQAKATDVLARDEHAGKPGSYVFDPATGQRKAA